MTIGEVTSVELFNDQLGDNPRQVIVTVLWVEGGTLT
jgi:hypothetical protein